MTAEILLHLLSGRIGQQLIVDRNHNGQQIPDIPCPADNVPFVITVVYRAVVGWSDLLEVCPRTILEPDFLPLECVLVNMVLIIKQGKLQIIIDGEVSSGVIAKISKIEGIIKVRNVVL